MNDSPDDSDDASSLWPSYVEDSEIWKRDSKGLRLQTRRRKHPFEQAFAANEDDRKRAKIA
jgi:hypothetical protein